MQQKRTPAMKPQHESPVFMLASKIPHGLSALSCLVHPCLCHLYSPYMMHCHCGLVDETARELSITLQQFGRCLSCTGAAPALCHIMLVLLSRILVPECSHPICTLVQELFMYSMALSFPPSQLPPCLTHRLAKCDYGDIIVSPNQSWPNIILTDSADLYNPFTPSWSIITDFSLCFSWTEARHEIKP